MITPNTAARIGEVLAALPARGPVRIAALVLVAVYMGESAALLAVSLADRFSVEAAEVLVEARRRVLLNQLIQLSHQVSDVAKGGAS